MVTINLSDFNPEKNALLNTIRKKIHKKQISKLNEDIDPYLKVELSVIESLFQTIETRFRKTEMIHYTWLEHADHSTLTGQSINLPIIIDMEFLYNTSRFTDRVSIDDKLFYKEIIDVNFQHFVLLTASMYENIVRIVEILVKKVILHQPGKSFRPTSTPLLHYKSIFDSLILLGYRKQDILYKCFDTHKSFLDKILISINTLRNVYIHGYQGWLVSDGFNYRINHTLVEKSISPGSPILNIDEFSIYNITNSKLFITDLFNALTSYIKPNSKVIPA